MNNPEKESLLTQQAFALSAFASELARAANSFCTLTSFFLGRLFEMVTTFHFTEQAFTLHFLFQRFQSLVDIIVAHNDLYDGSLSIFKVVRQGRTLSFLPDLTDNIIRKPRS